MDAREPRHDLYPSLEPDASGMLRVDATHQIYWETSGNPDGVPVLFVHGGPGAGTNPGHRRFFDPAHYRIILFDQRGAGRSKPYAEVKDNTTAHIISDMEALRRHLAVEEWLLFGGSWGSTLAIAYGIAHPERTLGFILRGIFLGRRRELDWFLGGIQTIYPEAWAAFVEFIPENEQSELLAAYHRRLLSTNAAVHGPAAQAWNRFEQDCSTHQHTPRSGDPSNGYAALALARIEAHYFINHMFLDEDELLENLHRISHLPARLIQGRYDMVCPMITAHSLAQAWPTSELVVIADAGHSAMEPGTRAALVEAMEDFKIRIG
ncbi:MAG: prolyl aminopeptidase [Rhodospirillales bacterium]|nr:prolyl aminopeptidase [Rhodospirillales bacterium]